MSVPRYGTTQYRALLYQAVENDGLQETTSALAPLIAAHGIRVCLDALTEWVCAIDYILPNRPALYRDITGVVDVAQWDDGYLDETRMIQGMTTAAKLKAKEEDIPEHEAFQSAMAMAEYLTETIRLWRPTVQLALRAAHVHSTRESVRAVLWKGPGVQERDLRRLRDACAFVHHIARYPIRVARELNLPVRPPDFEWLTNDRTLPPHLSLCLSPKGELSRDH